MSFSLKSIGTRLTVIRKSQGLSQEELAEKVGVSNQIISRYETAVSGMTLETAFKISEALGISLDELACRTDYTVKS